MKVLVTGASGFVGKALREQLLSRGCSVNVAVRSPGVFDPSPETFLVGAIGAATDWAAALKSVEVVVHLAARVHVMNESESDSAALYHQVNTMGTIKLMHDAARAGVKRFIFISTAKVNGEVTVAGVPFSEADSPNPSDAYSSSKYEAELALSKFSNEQGMQFVIIRPPLVYGPGVKGNFATLLRAVRRGLPLPLGAVNNRRSLVGLNNLVDFIITCARHPLAANQTFLVSDGADVSTPNLVRAIAHATGRPTRLISVPVRMVACLSSLLDKRAAVDRLCGNFQLDITKAEKLLNWVPTYTLEEGLRHACEEFKT